MPLSSNPLVSVVIVNWNTRKLLHDCLNSVFQETKECRLEVWVVDNNSPDGSAEMVAKDFPEVKLIANKDNVGFAPANNQALSLCTGDYILLLNPDTVVLAGAIDKMAYWYKANENKQLGIVTCKLLNADGSLQKSVNPFYSFWSTLLENRFLSGFLSRFKSSSRILESHWEHDKIKDIDWAYGAVMFFSRKVFDTIGLLDERFYIYAEEIDYFMRIRKAGLRSVFLPDVHITHFGGSSSKQKRAAMFIQNYKSFYLFLNKHYGGLSYWAYRLRAQVYLVFWLIKYSLGKDEESKVQKQVYKETLLWHFKAESFKF